MFESFDSFLQGKEKESNSINLSQTNFNVEERVALFYSRLEALGMVLDEIKPILEQDGSMLILSGAGAGKTTALMLKIIYDLITGKTMRPFAISGVDNGDTLMQPSKILVSTFLSSGASELKKAFEVWCDKLDIVGISSDDIQFKTLHAEYLALLKSIGINLNLSTDCSKYLREVANTFGCKSIRSSSRTVTLEELSDIESMVSYSRNRLDSKRYDSVLLENYNFDSVILQAIVSAFKEKRRLAGVVDFDDLQELLYGAITSGNENVINLIKSRYDYMYIDEFQDTAQIQYEVLKTYFAGCKQKVVIGDDDQTIYSWRGSDNTIITSTFEQDFSPIVCNLSLNYRCPSNILNAVIPSIECNTVRRDKDLKSSAEGGELYVLDSNDIDELLKGVYSDVQKDNSVFILARTNNDLLLPAIMLELKGGINFSVSKSIGTQRALPKQVFGLMSLVLSRYRASFTDYLYSFVPYRSRHEVDSLISTLKVNKGVSIYNMSERDAEYSAPTLYANLLRPLREAYQKESKVEVYLFLLDALIVSAYSGDTSYAVKAREFIMTVKSMLRSDLLKDKTLDELYVIFNETMDEALAKRSNSKREAKVKLSTIHDAKGKEKDSVYIWSDIDGVFPATAGNRELSLESMEEERRVHYIAFTRARKKLTICTDATCPSPFLLECDLSFSVENCLDRNYVPDRNATRTLGKVLAQSSV